jgi:hypothetical protein
MADRTADGCFFLRASGAMTSTFDTGAGTRHPAGAPSGGHRRALGTFSLLFPRDVIPTGLGGAEGRANDLYRSAGHGKVVGLSEKAVEGWIKEAEAHEV